MYDVTHLISDKAEGICKMLSDNIKRLVEKRDKIKRLQDVS